MAAEKGIKVFPGRAAQPMRLLQLPPPAAGVRYRGEVQTVRGYRTWQRALARPPLFEDEDEDEEHDGNGNDGCAGNRGMARSSRRRRRRERLTAYERRQMAALRDIRARQRIRTVTAASSTRQMLLGGRSRYESQREDLEDDGSNRHPNVDWRRMQAWIEHSSLVLRAASCFCTAEKRCSNCSAVRVVVLRQRRFFRMWVRQARRRFALSRIQRRDLRWKMVQRWRRWRHVVAVYRQINSFLAIMDGNVPLVQMKHALSLWKAVVSDARLLQCHAHWASVAQRRAIRTLRSLAILRRESATLAVSYRIIQVKRSTMREWRRWATELRCGRRFVEAARRFCGLGKKHDAIARWRAWVEEEQQVDLDTMWIDTAIHRALKRLEKRAALQAFRQQVSRAHHARHVVNVLHKCFVLAPAFKHMVSVCLPVHLKLLLVVNPLGNAGV